MCSSRVFVQQIYILLYSHTTFLKVSQYYVRGGVLVETVKSNRDFKKMYKTADSFANRQLAIYFKRNSLPYNRYGFSVSKKIGNAVVRNKMRRRLKEIIRTQVKVKNGYDIIFIARQNSKEANYEILKNSVSHLLKKTKLSL